MIRTNSLRFRVAFYYALFGIVLSILLSGGVYWVVRQNSHLLIDEILLAELDEHSAYPEFEPPNTLTLKGYELLPGGRSKHIPAEIRLLSSGGYTVPVRNRPHRVLVVDKPRARYFMTFDMRRQQAHEAQFFIYVVYFSLFLTISSALGGILLANRVTASVTRLARQVGQAEPSDASLSLAGLAGDDEVGELARAFDRYLRRLREFIERENYFTADVSHELRTPLAVMLGSVEVLEQDEALSSRQKERLARIRRAAQDMSELTWALLMMAREPQYHAEKPSGHVSEVVRRCVEKHLPLIASRPIRMETAVLAEPELDFERPLLEMVIGNLIRNALNNTRSGFVRVSLEADRLRVSDSGIGMRPEELARAMERYYKGTSSTGSGVGLSLVRRICERYGWRIHLESREGEGTMAEIEFFPADNATANPQPSSP